MVWQPHLQGDRIRLRPLVPADWDALFAAASDPLIWEQHPDSQRFQAAVFRSNFFEGAVQSRSALVAEDIQTGAVIGSSRYYDWNAQTREVAVGYTFLVRSHWGGHTNREMKRLMLGHIFQWATRVWFHIGVNNLRSRRALESIGGVFDRLEPHTQVAHYRIDSPFPSNPTHHCHE